MIDANFEKIDYWLKQNAERIAIYSLQAPATEEQLDELETVIGKPLPVDFKELYLWHNGLRSEKNFGSFFFGMDFFPIDRMISEYNDHKEMGLSKRFSLKKADPEIDPSNIFNVNWLKFGFDGSHTALYLDLSPTSKGKYGQIIFIDDEYETGILVAGSTSELIAAFKNDLESNLYHLNSDALEDGNHYLETSNEIDIVNWQISKKWNR